jgi:hypothetical protein
MSRHGGRVWRHSVKSGRVRCRPGWAIQKRSDQALVRSWFLFFVDCILARSGGITGSSPLGESSFDGSGTTCHHTCEDKLAKRQLSRDNGGLAGDATARVRYRVASLHRGHSNAVPLPFSTAGLSIGRIVITQRKGREEGPQSHAKSRCLFANSGRQRRVLFAVRVKWPGLPVCVTRLVHIYSELLIMSTIKNQFVGSLACAASNAKG